MMTTDDARRFSPAEQAALDEAARLLPGTTISYSTDADGQVIAVHITTGGHPITIEFDRGLLRLLTPWQLGTLIIRRTAGEPTDTGPIPVIRPDDQGPRGDR